MTIQGLLQECRGLSGLHPDLDPNATYCLGYVGGIGDYLKGMGLSGTNPKQSICGDISYGAAAQAFTNWAQKHPERWSENRLIGVVLALRETWPCNPKSN